VTAEVWTCPGLPGGRPCPTPHARMADTGPRVMQRRLCVGCLGVAISCAWWIRDAYASAISWPEVPVASPEPINQPAPVVLAEARRRADAIFGRDPQRTCGNCGRSFPNDGMTWCTECDVAQFTDPDAKARVRARREKDLAALPLATETTTPKG